MIGLFPSFVRLSVTSIMETMRLCLKESTYKFPPNATFICSVPSWGNVGQMAVDVCLATLHEKKLLERIGSIESSYILPMDGYDR